MKKLIFVTGNELKFKLASAATQDYGIELIQKELDIDEIQGEDAERIARDKSAKAFREVGEPVVTSDDSWAFGGLGGFPGVYMKSMNSWLSTEDFLRLTAPLKDRGVILTQMVVYQDKSQQKVFSRQLKGRLLKEARGHLPDSPNQEIIAMDGDDGKSIAEVYYDSQIRGAAAIKVWEDFFDWFKSDLGAS